tara:strand:- start:372 stop:587 length:216 start_codon:yes stop_codon:yes gene_type:complete
VAGFTYSNLSKISINPKNIINITNIKIKIKLIICKELYPINEITNFAKKFFLSFFLHISSKDLSKELDFKQ